MDLVLVVDDEPDILELLRLNLSQAGYGVETAATGEEAFRCFDRSEPDLVILDLMLPDCSGTDICRKIRSGSTRPDVPILMLTAKGEEVDRVVGFELGADDYVTKPFSPRELLLRVKAILKRSKSSDQDEGPTSLQHDQLLLDLERHRCRVGTVEVALTAKEFKLLRALMSRPGRVMTRDRLMEEVWESEITVTPRTIDTHMKRLREKLGTSGVLIDTIRGVGYRFAEPVGR